MTVNSKRNLKVGITVVTSFVILLYGIAFLKDIKLGIETYDLTVYFRDANGLKEGDPVSVNGVIKGKVKKIDLAGDSVKVDFNIAKEIVLKQDYNISVAMIELMSGKQIYIKPGLDKKPADITKPLVGAKTADIVSLIGTMSDIGEDVKAITAGLTKTTEKLNITLENVNSIVGDEGLKANIRGTASNFNIASRNLNLMIAETKMNVGTLTHNLNGVVDKVGTTVDETRPELKQTVEDIRMLTSKLDTLTDNLNLLVINAKDTNTTVGKLLTEDDLYNNLNKTIISINKLVKQIKKDGIQLKLF
jgi:phospholipid/cholesterol/gamma-HCH transport system substrate-binding protein